MITFSYRGFGNCEGNASEKGTYRDVEAAYQYLRAQGIEDDSIVAYGYSLGGGVATELAARYPVDLILDRSFSRLSDVAYDRAVIGTKNIAKLIFYVGL